MLVKHFKSLMKHRGITLLILVSLITVGCSNSPNYSIHHVDVKSADKSTEKWIEKNSKANGTYLGKTHISKKSYRYYLYINYTNPVNNEYYSANQVSMRSGGNHAMIINVKSTPSDEKWEKIFYIDEKEQSLKKIVLNGEDIKTSSIPVIE